MSAEYQLYCFAQSGNAYRVALMLPLGLIDVSRTGIVAISRGAEGM